MSQATESVAEILLPPRPGEGDAVDEMLAGIAAPPQTRRWVLTGLLTGVALMSFALAFQLKDDARYAMASGTPRMLGAGRTVDAAALREAGNQYVSLQASPSMAGAVQYSRWLFPGEHLVFPVAGREGEALYVQVSADRAEAMSRGEFAGRLVPFEGAGGRYAPVGRYLHDRLGAPVQGRTWLVVDGAAPRNMMWAPPVVLLLLALGLSDVTVLVSLLRRRAS
ncbi:MAG: hypothetical protein JNK72_02930 [Myxococcales bacterium]|nr:hypothetical protein [Myxococcales bacterium]